MLIGSTNLKFFPILQLIIDFILLTSSLIFGDLAILHVYRAPGQLTSPLINDLQTALVIYGLLTHL